MLISYFNGSYIGATKSNVIDFKTIKDSIIEVKNVGTPFRGNPKDMVDDVLAHVVNIPSQYMGFIPVICQSSTGTDKYGIYTTDVIFQAVFLFPY